MPPKKGINHLSIKPGSQGKLGPRGRILSVLKRETGQGKKYGKLPCQHHIVSGLGRLPDGSTLIPGEPRQAWLSQYQVLGTEPWRARARRAAAIAMCVPSVMNGGSNQAEPLETSLRGPLAIRIEAVVR